jgi:hypothetical protein
VGCCASARPSLIAIGPCRVSVVDALDFHLRVLETPYSLVLPRTQPAAVGLRGSGWRAFQMTVTERPPLGGRATRTAVA